MSSSDSDEVEYDDSSDTMSDGNDSDEFYNGMTNQYRKCWMIFIGRENNTAIGCDNPLCRHWYHPLHTDLDTLWKDTSTYCHDALELQILLLELKGKLRFVH